MLNLIKYIDGIVQAACFCFKKYINNMTCNEVQD